MLELRNVSVISQKEYRLQDISLKIESGSIYGLIGANGAGKTTLIKAILGLVEINNGFIKIDDLYLSDNRNLLSKIGTLIERASLYTHLTAIENLTIASLQLNVPESEVQEILKLVGLFENKDKKVEKFSLGMKQRLGIGLAIINKPSLLILDEPTNGLDPDGIIQIRELIISINKQFNTTVLFASHLLNEIELVATHIGFIQKGNLVFHGHISDFKTIGSLEKSYQSYAK